MQTLQIWILCIQETHYTQSDHWITDAGYLVIFSGNKYSTHAGVGFIIAPFMRKAIYGFDCLNARLMSIKIRVPGGKIAIINGYAPHSGLALEDRPFVSLALQCKYNVSQSRMKHVPSLMRRMALPPI